MIRIIQTGVTEIYVADSTSNYSNDSTWFEDKGGFWK